MKKSEEMKERIIRSTIELIEQGNGKVEELTTRMIAEKAGIGIGLIHYHFQTKDNLVEICVQRMITRVIWDFTPSAPPADSQQERIKASARQVADFLAANPAISRISILGDMGHPASRDNTALTMAGFAASWRGKGKGGEVSGGRQTDTDAAVFALTAVMQAAFLRRNISRELFGCDMDNKEERDRFIGWLADRLFGGEAHEQ